MNLWIKRNDAASCVARFGQRLPRQKLLLQQAQEDEHYIDALKKLYEEKVGAERDLGLKAADNLVADRVTFGLPDLDLSAPRGPYRGLDELKNAPDSVKKIFSLEMGTRRERTEAWKREMIERCALHSIDGESCVDDGADSSLVDARRRHRQGDAQEADVAHSPHLASDQLEEEDARPVERPEQAWAEAQLRSRVEEEKEKRLEALHVKYASERETRLSEMRARREELEKGIADIDRQLHEITVFEDGEERPSDKKYQQALVGELTEKVIHSQLFYHPKPTMTRNV
uniref:Mrps-15 n=1 Tax=Pristionchus pacificus TaxID=54126 RepID=A0A2A6BVF8_PRIPA|eukprot:PDM69741.1 mrps-15 [Pristionchus pacificus]